MRIAIIGCGYIGTALAIYWSQKKHFLTATTRSPKKLKMLTKLVQRATIYRGATDSEIYQLIKDHDTLCLTLSANNRNEFEKTFLATAQEIKKASLHYPEPKTILFISKGTVYGDHQGMWVDENTDLKTKTSEGKVLIEAEKTLLSLEEIHWKIIVFRLGEIYGPGREVSKKIKNLQKKSLPGDGSYYVNFVHQEDVVKATDYLIFHNIGGLFNLSDDEHPTEKECYDRICTHLHLPLLQWNSSAPSSEENGNYRLSNHKIKKEGYELRYPHLEIT